MSKAVKLLERQGPILANTVYDNDILVGQDVEFTIPMPKWQTADVEMNGTVSVPMVGRSDNMQLSIKHIGVDVAWSKTNTPGNHKFEFRYVQPSIGVDGKVTNKGVKCFVDTFAPSVADIGSTVGSASELENTYSATRVAIYIEGKEIFVYDRIAGTLRVDGKDYSNDYRSKL